MPYKEKDIEKKYFQIGEIASRLNVNNSTIRFWLHEFQMDEYIKRAKIRYYRMLTPEEVAMIEQIHNLLKVELYTLKGAKQKMSPIISRYHQAHGSKIPVTL